MVENPFTHLDDKELMLKYQDGDHMAFNTLYIRHKDKVYSYIAKRLHSSNEVEDLFQKVFIKFHKSRKLYNAKYQVLPWIYTITKSEYLDFIKKKKIDLVEFKEEFHSDQQEQTTTSFDINDEKLLSANEKKAISERYFNDKDFDEISTLLKTSESNARKLISRGLKKLKEKYRGVNS